MRAIEEDSAMIRAVLATAALTAALLTGAAPTAASAAPAETGAAPGSAIAAPAETGATAAVDGVVQTQAKPKPKPKATKLTLGYMAEAGYAAAVVLYCDPADGPHPNRVKACNMLKKVHGKPANLKPAHTMCMMLYAPITAQITGTWKGKKVSWSKTYGNVCEMKRATGVLFVF
jgi:hypothetical protein